ncbi:Global transcription regulator sge1 [Cytospora mali]|uniref:Global transcription regulator sge1 n=1 Tax=Cytospora mali TaxID=578113 RepID=A0A194VLF8_CYTMA|nr:Global transcription regulator sge1 [Valsa mali]
MDNSASQQQQRPPQRKRPRPSASRPSNIPLSPTWYGIVMTTTDALRLFEACLMGQLLHTARRPHDRERDSLIQSGNVFIFEESSSGIKRWTDGQHWSPSRILGNFLIYRELHKDFPPGDKKKAIKRKREGDPELQDGNINMAGGSVDDGQRALLGSLIDSYLFKEGGLMKKTISIKFNDTYHHLVSYYSYEDATSGRLTTPSQDPTLCNIRPRLSIMTNQEFRNPMEQDDPQLLDEVKRGMENTPYQYPAAGPLPQMPANMLQPYGTQGQSYMSMPMTQSINANSHMGGHYGHNTNSVMGWDHRARAQPIHHHPYQVPGMVDDANKRRSEPWESSNTTANMFSPGGMTHGSEMTTTGHQYYTPATTSYPGGPMPPSTMGSEASNFTTSLTSMAPPPQASPVDDLPITTMDFTPSMTTMAPMTTMDFAPAATAMAPMGPGNSMASVPSLSGSPLDGPSGVPQYFPAPYNTSNWNSGHDNHPYMSGPGNSIHGWSNASSSGNQHQGHQSRSGM